MANSSGGKCFIWFIFLCLGVAGYLYWKKYYAVKGGGAQSEVFAPSGKALGPLKGIITPEESCYLLSADEDTRAEEMHKRGYTESEDKKDRSLSYSFGDYSHGMDNCYHGTFKFFKHQNYFIITFRGEGENGKKGRDAFISGFSGKEKIKVVNDCEKGLYKSSDSCFTCDMGFKREAGAYIVLIMRSSEFSKTENRLPNPKVRKRDPRLEEGSTI